MGNFSHEKKFGIMLDFYARIADTVITEAKHNEDTTMFGHNLGLHVLKCPTGVYKYVGSVPMALMNLSKASVEDIMAGRTVTINDEVLTYRSPLFDTADEAIEYAAAAGYQVLSY